MYMSGAAAFRVKRCRLVMFFCYASELDNSENALVHVDLRYNCLNVEYVHYANC